MVTLAFAVMSSWLAIAFPVVMSITRAALRMRVMVIACIAISMMISRGFILIKNSQQAHGLTIIGVSEVMTRARTACNIITFNLTVATEVFCMTTFVWLVVVSVQRVLLLSSGMF